MLVCAKLLPLMLFTIATITTTHAKAAVTAPYPNSVSKISPEIINELKDFEDLIPKATVDEIVAEHLIIDSNFREVVKYLRSTQFTQLLQQAQQIPEVVYILDYLHLLAPDATAIAARQHITHYGTLNARSSDVQRLLEPQLNFVLLNELENNVLESGVEAEAVMVESTTSTPLPAPPPAPSHLRTFNSFVEELLRHLPHNQYVQLINQKRQKSLTFAQFYAALRSAELRPMVDATMKSPNLTTIIKTLTSHGIDVKTLEGIAFRVISWGPVPTTLP